MSSVSVERGMAEQGVAGGLPVTPVLRSLLPGGTLRYGTTVSVEDADLPVLLALAGPAAAEGTWAAVGLPRLGAAAAVDAGLDLARGLWVDRPGRDWPQVLGVLLEAVPLVLLASPGRVAPRTGQRLAALQRRTGAVVLVAGPWDGAQIRLRVAARAWEGVQAGHGLLRRRRVQIVATGRGAAANGGSATAWLPGPDGTPAPAPVEAGRSPLASPLTVAG
ncbi:hypothetical protein [Streptacidiphilus sp. PAMC 29251]